MPPALPRPKTVLFPLKLPPPPIKLQVKVGQPVDAGDSLAIWQARSLVALDIARPLSVKSPQVFKFLKRQIGELVHAGEILASRKTFWKQKKFTSPQTGRLTLTSDNRLALAVSGPFQQLTSPVTGRIREISSHQIIIQAPATEIAGGWGIGRQVHGPLIPLTEQLFSDLTLGRTDANLSRSLGLISFPLDQVTHNKLIALDLLGLFCWRIKEDLKQELSRLANPHPQLIVVESVNTREEFLSLFSRLKSSASGWLFGEQKRLLIIKK